MYRAVDSHGDTVDFLLRKRRDTTAAKAFFKKAIKNNDRPKKTAIDKSGSNTAALNALNKNTTPEDQIEIRQNKYLNNIVEQDHRFIKKRVKPMLGFKNFWSASNTISGIESVRMIQKGQIHGFDPRKSAFQNFSTLMASSIKSTTKNQTNTPSSEIANRCDRAHQAPQSLLTG